MATVKETANRHNKAVRTVQEAAHKKRIPARKEGHSWNIQAFKNWPGRGSVSRSSEREYAHGGGKEADRKRVERLNARATRKKKEYEASKPKPVSVRSLPKATLVGSEKQVAYAESIRGAYIRVQEYDSHRDKKIEGQAREDLTHKSSIWWIENRKQYIGFDRDYRRLKKDYG